jgi:hypothetical protein
MRSTPWRTIALCATCAVLAGAGSAALADSGSPDTATAVPGKPGDGQLQVRKCMMARNDEAPHEVTCPKPGDLPPPGKPGGPGCFAMALKSRDGKAKFLTGVVGAKADAKGEAGTSAEADAATPADGD